MSLQPATDWTTALRPGRRIGHAIEAHERIGSTNDRARQLVEGEGADGVLVVAEEQVAGRGRRGRTWLSPPGRNLTVSVGLRPHLAAAQAWQLGLAVALAARDACLPHAAVSLKWPNDLVADDGAKLGGILVETAIEGDHVARAIAGIGINLNWPRAEMPAELRDAATSLAELARAPVDRPALLGALAGALEQRIEDVEAGRAPLAAYRAACSTLGALVVVETPDGVLEGRAIAIDDAGALVVETPGGVERVSGGEVLRVRAAVPA